MPFRYPDGMAYLLVKALVSAAIIVAVSELARRQPWLGSMLASLPLTSLLIFVWMYVEKPDPQPVAELSWGIFWLTLPSLLLFVVFPWLLERKMSFYPALALGCLVTVLAYGSMLWVLKGRLP